MKKTGLPRLLAGILSFLMLVWFAAPLAAGILNIANALGMLFFGAALLCVVFWKKLRPLLAKFCEKKPRKILLTVLCVLLCGCLLLTAATTVCVAVQAAKTPGDCGIVIVLGCQVHGENPSLLLRYRLSAARDYLNAHPDAVCIVSGGMGDGESITEAECMYRWLTSNGIRPDRILKEDRAADTWDNITLSKQLMEEQGLTGTAVLVSSGFHLYRAAQMAELAGLPCETLRARTSFYTLATYVFREDIAVWKMRLLGP